MKKFVLLTLIVFSSLTSKAQQYYDHGMMSDNEVWYFYITPDVNLILEKMKDTTYWSNIFDSIYFTKYGVNKNDGVPNTILWTRDDGKILKSSIDSIRLTKSQIIDLPTIPTNNNQLINGSGFITGITGPMITTALGYSPLSSEVDGSVTNEIELPSQVGQSGKILGTNGSSATWVSQLSWSAPASTGARSFNTAYRESATNIYSISLSSQISCSLSITGGQSGTVSLEISANGTSGWTPVGGIIAGSNTGTLTIGLSTVQITGGQLTYEIPATYYYRLTTNNITGSPTYTFNGGTYKILQ